MFYDPLDDPRPAPLTHNPFNALVGPRPIGWISTIGSDGSVNLAPFSYFNAVSADPPLVVFAPNEKSRDGTPKDTFRNVREIPEFVVNVATWSHREHVNETSRVLPYGENEFERAGLVACESRLVRPPRVADAPAALECRVANIVALPEGRGGRRSHLVIGLVVGIHIDEAVIVDGRVDPVRLRQISRLGYFDYAVVERVFEMRRPD